MRDHDAALPPRRPSVQSAFVHGLLVLLLLAAFPAQGQVLSFVQVIKDNTVIDGLDGAQAVAVSPDGAHLYVAGFLDAAVTVFRQEARGALTFVEVHKDGIDGVDGLSGITSVAVSPDGAHVYATGGAEDAVAVFRREAATGSLTFVEAYKEAITGIDGLDGARSVAVSPDGAHVYVASQTDDAVVAFSRNATTGSLTFVDIERDAVSDVDGLDGAASVAVSADGTHVYVASQTDDAVAVFRRDAATGALTYVQVQKDGIAGVDGLDQARSVTVSPDGAHLYVAGPLDSAVAVFSRHATTGALSFVEVHQDGIAGIDGLLGAGFVTVSPDGAHVYVAAGADSAVAVFSRNTTTGGLTFVEAHRDGIAGVDGLLGARFVTVSPDGAHVYVAGQTDDAVAVFSRNATTGALTFVEAHKDSFGLDGAFAVTMSPDGGHVYVAGASDDAVVVFQRDAATGALTFVEMHKDGVGGVDGLAGARSVAVSPGGQHLYVASQGGDAVVVFQRDAATGALTFVEMHKDGSAGVDGLEGAISVTVSPGGQHLYVAGSFDNAVAVFSRNATTGSLTFVEMHTDNIAGVDGLAGARSVAVSPGGQHLYVAGALDDAVAVFSRNATTGSLTFVEMHTDDIAGVDGLDAARSVAVGLGGQHLYVASQVDDAVAVFRREAATGALTFVEMHKDGVGGVDGLDGAFSVTVSPGGQHVYVAGGTDDAVAVFSRNATTGSLTFVEMHKDGSAGVDGLDGAVSVAVSPDGVHLYVAGFAEDAVAVFRVNDDPGPTPVEHQHAPPARFALHPSYPNPFQSTTTIAYDVEAPARVVLRVYNVLGQAVATLVDGPHRPGRYEARLQAAGLPSGVYVYRIEMGAFRAARMLLLVR